MKKHKDYTDDFLAFWGAYPKQLSCGVWHKPAKREAFEVWVRMTESQKAHAMYSVSRYAKTVKDGLVVAHARTWLNQYRYEDFDMPDEGERLPESLTDKMKTVPEKPVVNFNNERNRQMKDLKTK